MYCKGCKNPLPKKAERLKFCVYCGKPTGGVPTLVKATPPLAVLGVVVVAIALMLRPDPGPDLVIQEVACSPAIPSAGQSVDIDVTVKNKGNRDAAASVTCCYVDDTSVGSAETDPIPAGSTVSLKFHWTARNGDHIVKVTADCASIVKERSNSNNSKEVTISVPSYTAPTSVLKVNTNVEGFSVYVNETLTSEATSSDATINGLADGTYTLKLTKTGYLDWKKQISITRGQTTTVYAYLETGEGIATTRSETILPGEAIGTLKVNTGRDGARVAVGGEFGGTTDDYRGATVNGLLDGTYTLKVTMAGYKEWTKQVSIAADQTTTVYAYLEVGEGTATTRSETIAAASTFGTLKVNTGRDGASVAVGGEFGGTTDDYSGATVNGLTDGTYTLKVTMAGYKEWTKQVSITTGQTTTVYAYLETGAGSATTRSETIAATSTFGTLKVNTGRDGVSVAVGGEFGGTTDDYSGATVNGLLEGTYTLKLTLAGYKEWTKQVSITTGQTTTVYAYLETGAGSTATRAETITPTTGWGTLAIDTDQTAVSIWIGDAAKGYEYGGGVDSSGNNGNIKIPAGTYTLKLTKTEFKNWSKQLSIAASQTTKVYAYVEAGSGDAFTRAETITPSTAWGTLAVDTNQTAVSIWVGDPSGGYEYGGGVDSSGNSGNVKIPAGTYTLKFTKTEFKNWSKQTSIASGTTTAVYAYLEAGSGDAFTRAETITPNTGWGTLAVDTNQTAVSIWVGGEYGGGVDSSGNNGNIKIPAGTYTLKFTKTEFKNWSKQTSIAGSTTTSVYAYLEAGSGDAFTRAETITPNTGWGTLALDTDQTAVSVWVGNEYAGGVDSSGNNGNIKIPAGTYTLKLTKTGYKNWSKLISIASSATTTVYAYLEAGAGDASTRSETITPNTGWGTLSLNTNVAGVSIWVDGEFGGLANSSGDASVKLPAGTYTLKLAVSGYQDWVGQVTITAGGTTVVDATLVPL